MSETPPHSAYQPHTEFGSRNQYSQCAVCTEEFDREAKVVWRSESGRYAHREHFDDPIPEPPGTSKITHAGTEL